MLSTGQDVEISELPALAEAGIPGVEIAEIVAVDKDTKTGSFESKRGRTTEKDAKFADVEKHEVSGGRPDGQNPQLSKGRKIALVCTVTGAALMNTMSVQAAVIILPTIGRDLDIPVSRQQWIVSSYALAFGCFLLLWGRLADVYGKRPIFILGSAWVSVVTLICPFVPNEIVFDTFRGLQGLGGAANVPTAIGILGVTFEPGKAKNYAFATYAAGAPMGAILGNILSGVVAQFASWKWVFWILAIVAAATAVAGHFLIPLPTVQPSESELKNAVDWIGGTIVTVALFILLFALTQGNSVGWSTPYIGVTIGVSIVLLVVFVFWQLYLEKKTDRRPLVKISLFARKRVAAALFVMAMFFSSFNNYIIFVTYQFQDYQGLDPLQTSLRFIPCGVVGICAVFTVSQILSRVPVNFIVTFGVLCLVICSLLFAVPIPPDTTYWAYAFPSLCLCVMAADTLFPSLILFNSHSLPQEDQSLGGALINAVGQTFRAIGLAIGIAIQIAVQESHQQGDAATVTGSSNLHNPAFLAGLRAGQWFSVAMAVAALLVVIFVFKGAGIMGGKK